MTRGPRAASRAGPDGNKTGSADDRQSVSGRPGRGAREPGAGARRHGKPQGGDRRRLPRHCCPSRSSARSCASDSGERFPADRTGAGATARKRGFQPPSRRSDGTGGASRSLQALAGWRVPGRHVLKWSHALLGLGARSAAGPTLGAQLRCPVGGRGMPGGDLSEAVSFWVFRDAGLDAGLHAGQEPGEAETPDQCLVQAEGRRRRTR